jgi:sulfur carrier protein ThiS
VPSVHIDLPVTMTSPDPPMTVQCDGGTVGEALRDLVTRSPRYAAQVFFKDCLNVMVVLNGTQLEPARAKGTGLQDGDVLKLVTRVGGG